MSEMDDLAGINLTASLIDRTAEIVAAYVSRNALTASEIPAFILTIYSSLATVGSVKSKAAEVVEQKAPAVSIKKSITDEYLICLEDGLKFKSLKRHLQSSFAMTPDDYRAKWGLPSTYPMVAPSYSAERSKLALSIGLGAKGRASKAVLPKLKSAKAAESKTSAARSSAKLKKAA